jgi:hypothetical protein
MLKRVALLGAIAALTIGNPVRSVAQTWDGAGWDGAGWDGGSWDGAGWDGGRWGGGCCVTVAVRVAIRPRPWCCRRIPPRPIVCCRPLIPRPTICCRPVIPPRPVLCCNRPYPYYGRPLYYYGDSFAPFGYNPNAGYTDASYAYDE